MNGTTNLAIGWIEQGMVPDSVIRAGIRRLLRQRLTEIKAADTTAAAEMSATNGAPVVRPRTGWPGQFGGRRPKHTR